MSREAALAFLKKASQNAELQEKIVALAVSEGYEFSVEELTDAELEAAAGGVLLQKVELTGKIEIPDLGAIADKWNPISR